MKLENSSKKISVALLTLAVISLCLIAPAMSFRFGQSTGRADYAIFEGVAANDYYDSRQYSYKINQWAYDQNITGYEHTNETLDKIINPGNVYFDASKSLRVGFTEYGEFATPENAGIAYGADADEWNRTESWASSAIDPKYWIQGWTLYVNYSRAGTWRGLLAYAIYSDMNTVEAGRKVYTWYSTYDLTDPLAEITAGSLTTSGIQVLYDSARLAVGRTSVVIHDGKYNEDFAKVTFTVVFNKDTKYAIVYKDVKILLDPKVLDSIVDFAFSERYELDLARNINPGNEAYIHYYHNYSNTVYQHPLTGESTYDALQAFDKGMNYIYFAGYWPNATEYSVYSHLVPDMVPQVVDTTVLPPGFAQPDIPSPPGEPSTPWVLVQWRYNYANWPKMMYWLAKSGPYREIRFVEVVGMTDFNADPHPAMDKSAPAPYNTTNQLDTEVAYLLDQVFNPEDLTTINDDPFMWIGLGQSAATTDSAGAGLLPDMPQMYLEEPFMLFDRNDTAFPWLAPVIGMKGTIPYGLNEWGGNYYEQFSNSGKGTGTDTTLYKRTTLKGFAFGVYDDVIKSIPQPIAGGWSNYSSAGGYWYWYPSKDPLTERWKYTGTTWTMRGYDNVGYHPNGILSLGGMKANGLTRYFNDFYYAISREGTGAYALINGGTVTGSAPTSDFALATFDYYPISTWASSKSTFGYKEGYAVIALARDINGTRGLAIYGWDGRDTFWAAAWASQYLGEFNGWIPAGTVALVLKITYTTADREPSGFTVVKALGTITELGSNAFYASTTPKTGFDKSGVTWTGSFTIPQLPTDRYNVWWYAKLSTTSTAKVDFDP